MALKLGWIPYLNLAPLRFELERHLDAGVTVLDGHPTQVNRWLSEGQVDVCPSSSICLLRNPSHEIACHVGVVSDGPVRSVFIGFPRHLLPLQLVMARRLEVLGEIFRELAARHSGDVRSIAQAFWRQTLDFESVAHEAPVLRLTKASATSCGLAKLLYRQCFGEAALTARVVAQDDVAMFEGSQPELTLLIGDEALRRRGEFAGILDLGSAWKLMTGLPFVFAVWQKSGHNLSENFLKLVQDAADIAQARMRVEPGIYLDQLDVKGDQQRQVLADYWNGLRYRLTADDMRGLCMFLALVRPLLKLDHYADATAKLMRWQQASELL